MQNAIKDFIKWFIPPNISPQSEDYRKAGLVIYSIWITLFFSMIYLFVAMSICLRDLVDTLIITSIFFVTILFLFRSTGRLILTGNLFAANLFIISVISIIDTGGIDSPSIAWLILPTVAALMYANKNSAFAWAVVALAFIIEFFLVGLYGITFTAKYHAEARNVYGFFAFTGLFSYLLVIFVIYEQAKERFALQLKAANIKISEKNEEIQTQSNYLSEALQEITHSIEYAKRIQRAVLGDSKDLIEKFRQGFVLFEPRDIVSGDFFWHSSLTSLRGDSMKVLIGADCTGHGIPGAFMTIMGNALLDEIVNERKITAPNQILQELDQKVVATLQKKDKGEGINDGMDMAVLVVNETQQQAYFAGAKSPMWYISQGEIHQVKGSKYPIGSNQYNTVKVYESHTITLHPDTIFYLFSDGFQDQFGGSDNKKYLRSRFRRFLLSISHFPFSKQKNLLQQEFTSWKGSNEQTDDVLVIGVQV
ncbi:PP2C family protein-serine/threonine phosphatase [Microscilla marina]|uniref:Serine/threonine protein kinases, putative n=1 Tax=Microscilla marina ATCC 23134 TaxID=313606 RepID=A1ZM04_MICM2|nr:SpoIIE family protein phosphatase [Microscilla marina]EAY28536.1 serine/threonine protein kinases, putative [Microscilla marina ATCC 23134]